MNKPKPKSSTQRPTRFAEGGTGRMAGAQAANQQKPGGTAHAVKGAAPGAKAAKGGPKLSGHSLAVPAKGGHTAPIRKGR
jgi:hypothetical protein